MMPATKKTEEASRRHSGIRTILWMACLFWVLSLSSLFGMARTTTPSDPEVQQQPSNWAMQANSENPFMGKVFVSEANVTPFFASFRFWAFNTESSATVGKESLRREDLEGLGNRNEKQSAYNVDARRRTLTLDNAEYIYEFKNSKTVELKQLMESFTIYEVPSSPQVFFKSNIFLDNKGFADPEMKDPMMNMRLRMLNRYIAAAQADREAPPEDPAEPQEETPQPPEDPPPPPPTNPVTNITVINPTPSPTPKEDAKTDADVKPVDGQYSGTLTDTGDGSHWKFTMLIKSSGEPTGQPPMASIEATMKFEGVETEEKLIGTAVYSGETQLIMAGNSPRGTMTLKCHLSGDRLSGTWDSKGADGQTTAGTLEAARTGP